MECQGGEEGRFLLTLENAFLFFPERFFFTHVEESTPQLCCEGSKTKSQVIIVAGGSGEKGILVR